MKSLPDKDNARGLGLAHGMLAETHWQLLGDVSEMRGGRQELSIITPEVIVTPVYPEAQHVQILATVVKESISVPHASFGLSV